MNVNRVPMTLRTPSKHVMLVKEVVRSSHRPGLQLRVRIEFGAGPPEDQRMSLRARTPDSALPWSLPDNLHQQTTREVSTMKQIRDRVAGLDIHRDTVVACARIGGPTGI